MEEFLRKVWYFGLGVMDATKEKVEALVAEMVKRGEITQQESPEAVKKLLSQAQEAQQALVEKTKELVSKAVAELKCAKAPDLAALEERISALEREAQELRIKIQGVSGK